MTNILPDVHLTREICGKAEVVRIFRKRPRCCRNGTGTDVQSDLGERVRCGNESIVTVRLETGQIYDFCERHAKELGVRKWEEMHSWGWFE